MRTLFAAALVALAVWPVRADYQREVLADSPVGYWRLGEPSGTTATNLGSLGSGQNGTYTGSPTQGASGRYAGDANGAVELDGGTTQYVSVPDHAALSIYDTADITVEMWVRLRTLGLYIMSKSNAPSNQGDWQMQSDAGGVIFARVQSKSGGGVNGPSLTSGAGCVTDDWCHVVLHFKGYTSNAGCPQTVWVNTSKTAQAASCTGTDATGTTTAFHIGKNVADTSFMYDGGIDEVAIYTTTGGLTDAQVERHYKVGRGQFRRRRAALDNLARPPVLALARDSALPWLTLAALRNMETAMEVHVEP